MRSLRNTVRTVNSSGLNHGVHANVVTGPTFADRRSIDHSRAVSNYPLDFMPVMNDKVSDCVDCRSH